MFITSIIKSLANPIIKSLAKKYAVSLVNDLIKGIDGKYDIESNRQRILRIMRFLNNLMDYLEDKQIDDDESDKIIEEVKSLF